MAKVQPNGLQLKCKRGKRIVTIPFTSIEGWALPFSTKTPAKKTQGSQL
jgi:hypothetical protein